GHPGDGNRIWCWISRVENAGGACVDECSRGVPEIAALFAGKREVLAEGKSIGRRVQLELPVQSVGVKHRFDDRSLRKDGCERADSVSHVPHRDDTRAAWNRIGQKIE